MIKEVKTDITMGQSGGELLKPSRPARGREMISFACTAVFQSLETPLQKHNYGELRLSLGLALVSDLLVIFLFFYRGVEIL